MDCQIQNHSLINVDANQSESSRAIDSGMEHQIENNNSNRQSVGLNPSSSSSSVHPSSISTSDLNLSDQPYHHSDLSQSQSQPSSSTSIQQQQHPPDSSSSSSSATLHHRQQDHQQSRSSATPSPILSSLSLFNQKPDSTESSDPTSSSSSSYRLSALVQGVSQQDIQSLFDLLDDKDSPIQDASPYKLMDPSSKGKRKQSEPSHQVEESNQNQSLDYDQVVKSFHQTADSIQDEDSKKRLSQMVQSLVSFAQRKEEREENLVKKLQSVRIQTLSLLTKSLHSNSTFTQSQNILQDQLSNEIETLRSSIKILTQKLFKAEDTLRKNTIELTKERERERERERLREKERFKERETITKLLKSRGIYGGFNSFNWSWKLNQSGNGASGGSLNATPIRNQGGNRDIPSTEPRAKSDGKKNPLFTSRVGLSMDSDSLESEAGGMGPPVSSSSSMNKRPSAPPALGTDRGSEELIQVEQSPTPAGGGGGGNSSHARPNPTPTSQRLGEALELVTRSPNVDDSSQHGSGGLSASNSNESLSGPSRPATLNRTKSAEDISSVTNAPQISLEDEVSRRERSNIQLELEEKAKSNGSEDLSRVGDTDLTLDRSTLLKERSELASDKRYLKQRLLDAESQLVRFENELRNLRSIALSKGQFIEITKSSLLRNDDYSSALASQNAKDKSLDMAMGDIAASPYSQVYLDGKTFAERERERENLQEGTYKEFEVERFGPEEVSTHPPPSSSSSLSKRREKDSDDLGKEFEIASRLKVLHDREINRKNKKPTALMGDAESEHLLLAAKRLRELKELKEVNDLKLKFEQRQRHKERKEQREREERERSVTVGNDPFYPYPPGNELDGSPSMGPSSPSAGSNLHGSSIRSGTNAFADRKADGSSIFPSSAPNSAKKGSTPKRAAFSKSGGTGADRPRTPPRERAAFSGSPLKRGGSPINAPPRTPGNLNSRAFPTPGTTPGSAMDDLLHAAQTVLTPTGPRDETVGEQEGAEPYRSGSRVAEGTSINKINDGALLRSPLSSRTDPASIPKGQVLTPGRRGAESDRSRNGPARIESPSSGYASDEQSDSTARKRRRTQTAGGDFGSSVLPPFSSGLNGSSSIGVMGGPSSIIRTRPRSGTDVNAFHQSSFTSTNPIHGNHSLFHFNPMAQPASGVNASPSPNPQGRIGIGIEIPSYSHPPSQTQEPSFSQPMSALSALDLLADQAQAAASQNPSQSSENSLSRSQTDEEIGNLDSEDENEEVEDDEEGIGSQEQDDEEEEIQGEEGGEDPDRTARATASGAGKRGKGTSRNQSKATKNPQETSNKRKRSAGNKGKGKASDDSTSPQKKSLNKRTSRRKLNHERNDSKELDEQSSNGKKTSLDSNLPSSSAPTTANEASSSSNHANGHKRSKSANQHSRTNSRNGSIDLSSNPQRSPSAGQSSRSKNGGKEKEEERDNMSAQQRGAEKRVPYVRWSEEEDSKLTAAVAQYGQRWELIARSVKTRTYHQCRQRFLLMRRKAASKNSEDGKAPSTSSSSTGTNSQNNKSLSNEEDHSMNDEDGEENLE